MSKVRTVNAGTLISKFCELRRLTPSLSDWTEDNLASNPPRLYRLRQLIALFGAFDIPWDPDAFLRGDFVKPDMPQYDALISQLTEMVRPGARPPGRENLDSFFSILFEYRERLDGVLSFSQGVMEAGGLYLVAHRRIADVNQRIRDHVPMVDDLLAAVIDPKWRDIEMAEMVRTYRYPDVDLIDIDIDWW